MDDLRKKDDEKNGRRIKTSELRYRRLFETAQDGILILDAETGMITDVNPFLINMLGYSREEFVRKKLWEVGAFKDVKASQEAFQALQKNAYIRYENLPLKAKDGHLIQVEFVSNVYKVADEKVIQCNIRDITDRKHAEDALAESEANLRELSFRDFLTGLYNRRFMEESFDRELLRAARQEASLGLIMLDVDNFKRFNDECGHAAGDAILRELGKLIFLHIRQEDIPCRYGGDEFLIILPDTSREVTLTRASLLQEEVKRFQVRCEGQLLPPVTISVGIAGFPENGITSSVLLKAADTALYQAKHEGRGRIFPAQ